MTQEGDAPLPERPDTHHLTELEVLAGNEQLLAVLERHDQLVADLNVWDKARKLAAERLPAFDRLRALAKHAQGLDVAQDVEPQIEAILTERRLLDASDPVPVLASKLTDALRTALVASRKRYDETWDGERRRLEEAESWRQIGLGDRDEILAKLRIKQESEGRRALSRRFWSHSTASPSTTGECVPRPSPSSSRTRARRPIGSSNRRSVT